MNEQRYIVPPPPGEEPIDLTDAWPKDVAERVATGMQRMHAIVFGNEHRRMTEEEKAEYKRLSNDVTDAILDWLASPDCKISAERKHALIEVGKNIMREAEQLP